MTTKDILLVGTVLVIFAACRVAKNNSTAPSAATPAVTGPTQQPDFEATKYTHGVYPPGNQEVAAIQLKYPDANLAVLQQGYTMYSVGKCINCHGASNIYKYSEAQWKDIIDDMAIKANISNAEKDAVYKYVLAIKAAKPE